MKERVLLVGMMGSGKSTVGRLLAERLGVPYRDNDEALERRAGGGPGAVYDQVGASALHAIEADMVRTLVAGTAGSGAVIGVPASTIEVDEIRRLLQGAGRVVWLRATPETLAQRFRHDPSDQRPEFQRDMPGWLAATDRQRAPLFAEAADLAVDVDELTPWQAVQRIVDGLGWPAFGWLPGSFEGVVLDLDGLLVDTEVLWAEAKRALYEARGFPFSVEDNREVLGSSEAFTVGVFARRFGVGPEEHPQILDEYLGRTNALFAQGIPRRAGARELIDSLRGRVPLGLASNTRRSMVETMLAGAHLSGCFDVIVTGDEARPKPAPDVYLAACRGLGIDPARSMAVEDSPTGVKAAKAAGMTCIAVPSDAEHVPQDADRVAGSLLELIEPEA